MDYIPIIIYGNRIPHENIINYCKIAKIKDYNNGVIYLAKKYNVKFLLLHRDVNSSKDKNIFEALYLVVSYTDQLSFSPKYIEEMVKRPHNQDLIKLLLQEINILYFDPKVYLDIYKHSL